MKRLPKGAVARTTKKKRVDLYEEALGRLENEVGVILEFIREHNESSEHRIGFWASIRMIMPIVEAVSSVAGETPQEFLREHLDIPTPFLAWDLFRHSLIHGEYLRYGEYQSEKAGWGVTLKDQGHDIGSGHIYVDMVTLYRQLREFLMNEVARNDQTTVEVEVGITYSKPRQEILDDFSRL